MREIIVKREDIDTYTSIEITDENKLRIQMRIDEAGMHEDFALEEIDDLIESISSMKDRLERKTLVYHFPDGFTDRETLEKLTGLTIIATNHKAE